ncbi:MAG: DinB family protein [Candidatus Eisenbacteria bacterium]|nr:DinB family protein [Candidatus Eisenbacteria bacterium]
MSRRDDLPVNLRIDPGAWIAPGGIVVGEVTLRAGASVWFNSVLRGDTAPIEVGEWTNIQDNSTVHVDEGMPALIGRRVTIGHRSIVHGCVIEDDCLIGMGAVVLSGARIGTGSLLGAAALVKEGQVIPAGSLAVGAPARVLGPVNDGHRAAIAEGARHYAALARAYAAKGFARPHPAAHDPLGTASPVHGPMSRSEWGGLVMTLAESPGWVGERMAGRQADFLRARPAPERWSAHELVGHLLDADVEVYHPRLEALLGEELPACPAVDLEGAARVAAYAPAATAELLDRWRAARTLLVARLAPLGRAEWARAGVHSLRGPFTVATMVREWVEHDLSHRRQLAAALGLTP